MIKKITGVLIVLLSFSFTVHAEREKFVEITSHLRSIDVAQAGLDDDVWKEIKAYKQPLQEQFLEIPKPKEIGVNEVFVQSINDGKYIAFRLMWKDDTKNDTPRITDFSDGAAIQFPVQGTIFPEYFMGEKDAPVHIFYWKAWRSKDKESGYQTVKDAYPNMTTDIYTFDYPIEGQGTEKTQTEKNVYIPGVAAENPVSIPMKGIIAELSSTGPGTIMSKKTENTSGDAAWKDGQWTVIFRRPFVVDDTESVQFKAGEKMPIAFAVWEGSRMESGGRKAVSPSWAEVKVETR